MFINFRDIGKIINIEKVRDFSVICSEGKYYIHAIFEDVYTAEDIPAGETEKDAYETLEVLAYLISFKNSLENFSLDEKEYLLNEMNQNNSQNPESDFDDLDSNYDEFDPLKYIEMFDEESANEK